jgi:histidinol dehydrogenase
MEAKVRRILEDVRKRGDAAVAAALRRFDGVNLRPTEWRIRPGELKAALGRLAPERRAILAESVKNVRRFHEAERRRAMTVWTETRRGVTVGQRVTPVDAAGLYVPGGRFAYPSTVFMTAVPAKAAGVRRVVMVTPPRHLTDEVKAAAWLSGVDEVYQIGGVAAVAALAFGTKTVKPVDLIVGPGGAWVTEAKRQVFGAVGLDALAGPSEVVLIADGSANPAFAAADMMAQAEHDPQARATLISTDAGVLAAARKAVAKEFLGQCRFLKARDLKTAAEASNRAAPEHLSLLVKNPKALLPSIRHAGAIFLGPWSPVAAGDYWAGPSHVLPTARSARFSSGLSVQTFWKRSSIIELTEAALNKNADGIAALAEAEGLVRHAASLKVRHGS